MPSHGPNFITAIDVGSAKTAVLVAELSEIGLRYRGHGISESRGLRKGVITELDKAVGSIQKAVEHAEDVAGIAIEHALVGIAGADGDGRALGDKALGDGKPDAERRCREKRHHRVERNRHRVMQ